MKCAAAASSAAGGLLVDACTLDMEGPAVLLLIGDRGEQAS